jgi:hypothetical protein
MAEDVRSEQDSHGGEDFAEIATGLQQQIDDLTATLESHQRLFEQLRAAGVLPESGGR